TDGAITSTTSETASDSLRSVTESPDGTVWSGGEGIGLQFFRDNILLGDGRNGRLPSLSVHSVLADRDGTLWVGSAAGLTHISGGEEKTYDVSDGLAANVVEALEQDGDGSLWIGTSAGVSHLAGGTITTLPSDSPIDVRAVHADAAGHLWAGTSSGLRCLVNGRLAPCGDAVLRDASIFAFHQDAGALWIGTNRGLARMRGEHTTVYTTHDGLFDDTAYSILEDDEGTLWMSCDKGIHRVRTSDLDAYDRHAIPSIPSWSYDKSDGMAAAQCNGADQPASWKGHDGQLWFPTADGLATVDPKRLPHNALPPPVIIEQIAVNGHAVAPAMLASLAPGSRNLEFHYAALSFVAPEKVRFRYKLEGFDTNWIEAGARRAAYYTNVPYGSYRFRVMASNNDGVWNTKGDSLPMRIAPFYYETWWYRALAVFAVFLIIAIFYRARLWQVRRNERHLKAIVAEQTEELREANAALEELAAIDPLTQVANRRSLDAALTRMWAEHSRTGGSLAAILCDIDHFKKYNDTYGHQGGDETLIRVAGALASSVPRATDIVARFGGEEFVILLGHCTRDEAALVAERVLDSVRSLAIAHTSSPTAPHVTVSLGVASIVPDASAAAEVLVREADEALYRAKEGGRDRYAV
ncbi:MAG TPA: diguanylate cyclase, partial [Thermoanaerobaculia bacterium]|nr:diguanylate cyclase [Thermoanaerobaculia bacterium]